MLAPSTGPSSLLRPPRRAQTTRRAAAAALVALWLAPAFARADAPAPSLSRADVAASWAPTFYQETIDARDLIAAFDFDGDWDGSNNAAHLAPRLEGERHPLAAVVYYTVVETATHWLVTYVPYHPVDAKSFWGHDHDTEHVTLVVRKGAGGGRLEVMETRFHHLLFQYAMPGVAVGPSADRVDGPIHLDERGRPMVYIQRAGHGLCGGFSPPTVIPALSIYCDHDAAPHLDGRGVVYRFAGRAEVPRSVDDRDVGYALVEIGSSLWRRARLPDGIGPHATYSDTTSFAGARCKIFRCPTEVGGSLAPAPGHDTTGMPWDEGSGEGGTAIGEAFLDPAFTLARRLRMTAPFSTEYAYNPYLGIGSFVDADSSSVTTQRP